MARSWLYLVMPTAYVRLQRMHVFKACNESHALQLVATVPRSRMPASPGLSNALRRQRHLSSRATSCRTTASRPVSRDTFKGKDISRDPLSRCVRDSPLSQSSQTGKSFASCDAIELWRHIFQLVLDNTCSSNDSNRTSVRILSLIRGEHVRPRFSVLNSRILFPLDRSSKDIGAFNACSNNATRVSQERAKFSARNRVPPFHRNDANWTVSRVQASYWLISNKSSKGVARAVGSDRISSLKLSGGSFLLASQTFFESG